MENKENESMKIYDISAAMSLLGACAVIADTPITIERIPEFNEVVNKLSSFICSLNLPVDQNDKLVALVIEQVQVAEKGAFAHGFRMGLEHAKWEQEHPDTNREDTQ